jgi:ribosome-associated toxin RatA of RatAB toxin-antitoxin module
VPNLAGPVNRASIGGVDIGVVTLHRAGYHFTSTWRLPADPDVVYAALVDVAAYPRWWPQVRSAQQLDEQSGELRCRSLLPYELVFVAREMVADPVSRVLRARLDGDLSGESEWRITAHGEGATAIFIEDVEVAKPMLRRLGLLARPLLQANHDLMMRSGETGLRRHLAAVNSSATGSIGG